MTGQDLFLTRREVREVDRRAIEDLGLPGIALMENAGRGAADLLLTEGISGTVCICTGAGNNGGDGFVIARHLLLAGRDVRILHVTPLEKLQGDAEINWRVAQRLGIPIRVVQLPADEPDVREEFAAAEWIVDALLGTGLHSDVRTPFDRLIELINEAEATVLAVDLPSGLDCDTGRPLGCAVRADLTVTFVARKAGFRDPESQQWTGRVHVVGIGVPADLAQRLGD